MQTEVEIVKTKKLDLNSIKAFVVLENKTIFDDVKPFYQKNFLNASLKEISERVVGKFNYNIVNIKRGDYDSLISEIKNKVGKNIKTIIVVFADACVLENATIDIALNRCELTEFVNLNKSFVCKVEYLKQINLDEIWNSEVLPLAEKNVPITKSTYLSDLEFAFQNMIVHNLMREQVKFLSLTDVKIEFSVSVGKNTIIGNGTTLIGETDIGENCNLVNVAIENSFVQDKCILKNVMASNSIIKEGNVIAGRNGKKPQLIENVIVE